MERHVPTLVGHWLVLRAVRRDDLDAVTAISFYDGRPARDGADAAAMLDRIAADVAAGSSLHWGICVDGADAVVGTVGFYRGFERRIGEVGYVLNEAFRGSGIMTRAVRMVVAYGFDQLGLERVEATTDRANRASQAVLSRAGFRLVGDDGGELRFAIDPADGRAAVADGSG